MHLRFTQGRHDSRLLAVPGRGKVTRVLFLSRAVLRRFSTNVFAFAYRCKKLKCRAAKADEQQGQLRLSRRALQSELLAAWLVTVHAGWQPGKAMADSQPSTESADQELDLTITDKVSGDQKEAADIGLL